MKRFMLRLSISLFTFIIGVTISVGWYAFRQTIIRKEQSVPVSNVKWADYGTLMWHVQMAKTRGEKEYVMGSIGCGMGVATLEETLSNYTIVVAQPIEKKTYADTYGLSTWYRFRIIETLSTKTLRVSNHWSSYISSPANMLPINADEFLMPESGGTLVIDGITVTEYSNSPQYSLSKRYLLFLELDSAKKIGGIPWADEVGIFTVDDDGTLQGTDDDSYELKDKLASRFDNSMQRLKVYLEHRRTSNKTLNLR